VTSAERIRVVVVDDQALVRAGFRMILEAETDLVVAGEAADGEQAVALISADPPDVVLMDVRMPGVDGIEATRRILDDPGHSGVRVIMLTTFDMDEYVYDALRAGASGFVLKDVPPEQLVDGIRAVHTGSSLLSPSITRRMIEARLDRPAAGPPPRVLESLTPREREILGLLGRGLSNAEIADSLVVSETTVKTHVGRVLMKLQLRDRVQAVIFAYESGVVTLGSNPAAGR
jgi:DNA-binding NarL/FixJ family response regulator